MTTIKRLTETAGAEKKKIEFVKFISSDGEAITANSKPHEYENIVLIRTSHNFDIMYAYHNDSNDGLIYLGHFNDGVV